MSGHSMHSQLSPDEPGKCFSTLLHTRTMGVLSFESLFKEGMHISLWHAACTVFVVSSTMVAHEGTI